MPRWGPEVVREELHDIHIMNSSIVLTVRDIWHDVLLIHYCTGGCFTHQHYEHYCQRQIVDTGSVTQKEVIQY